MEQNKFYISEDLDGKRLDLAVATLVDSWSRAWAADCIIKGDVQVNSCRKKPSYKVKQGECISVTVDMHQEQESILPEDIPVNIIHEDNHLLVINKSPGVVVHPAPGNMSHTLVNALLFHVPEIRFAGDDALRSGIVHRLDKDTSGLMVVAKDRDSLAFLQKEFKYRRVEKKYLAIVHGKIQEKSGVIEQPIGRHPLKRNLMAVNHEGGKPAVTCWEIRQQYQKACLVEILLKTGRTHQIRVHFYAMDHPLLGDQVYLPRRLRKQKSIAPRQMLHSWRLSFRHPYTGQRMDFLAEPPKDFKDVQQQLEKNI